MLLRNIQAIPDPRGNRINLSWMYPENEQCCGVLVFRSLKQFTDESEINQNALRVLNNKSELPDEFDGKTVWYVNKLSFVDDYRLKALTWYYYLLIPCTSKSEDGQTTGQVSAKVFFHFSKFGNRICVPVTAAYSASNQMYKMLPAIYHRYDANEADTDKAGPLQKYLDIPGSQYDLLRSMSAMLLEVKNIESTPGKVLPLLGHWIGWQPNHSLGYTSQRNEIRNAPEIYKTIGILSNLKALVNRVTNCKTEVKEFANNVFITNEPVSTTIWAQNRINEEKVQPQRISCHTSPDSILRSAVETSTARLRTWIFFHTNYNQNENECGTRIEYKLLSGSEWSHSYRLESDAIYNKFPAAVPFCNGMLLFWSIKNRGDNWNITSQLISRGEDSSSAIVKTTPHEKYILNNNVILTVAVNGVEKDVTFLEGDFSEIDNTIITAYPDEIARHINRQLSDVSVDVTENGAIIIRTLNTGSTASIEIKNSSALSVIDFAEGNYSGTDESSAKLIGNPCDVSKLYNAIIDKVLSIRVDTFLPQIVKFTKNNIENTRKRLSKNEITADPDMIALQINSQCKGIRASVQNGNCITLQSTTTGSNGFIGIDYTNSSAAGALGFPPEFKIEDTGGDLLEPSIVLDNENNVWLACSKRSVYKTNIVCFALCKDNGMWEWKEKTPELTQSCVSEREPFLCLQKESDNSVLWCLWSRRLTISINKDTQSIWKTFYCKLKMGPHENWSSAEALNYNGEEIRFIEQRYPWAGNDCNGKFCIHTVEKDGNWSVVERSPENFTEGKTLIRSGFLLVSPLYIQHENLLLYRSSQPIPIKSTLNQPTSAIDHRWCGSTTICPGNRESIFEMETLSDTMRYTYETVDESGKDLNDTWYSFNTIGIYLTPYNMELMQKMQVRIKELVEELRFRCLPIHLRLVFIFNPYIYNEYLEEDGNMFDDDSNGIIGTVTNEKYRGIYSKTEDSIPEWTLFHSKDTSELPQSKLGDINDRTWHPWVKNRKRKS